MKLTITHFPEDFDITEFIDQIAEFLPGNTNIYVHNEAKIDFIPLEGFGRLDPDIEKLILDNAWDLARK